jgi:hypothetical protein
MLTITDSLEVCQNKGFLVMHFFNVLIFPLISVLVYTSILIV